jgi:hypothetical protein
MVRRFRNIQRYPGTIPQNMSAAQSPVPSQNVETPLPYDPKLIPDMHRVPPQGEQYQGSDVRAVYDSRFPNTIDWYWTDWWRSGLNQFNGFNCPLGYTMVVRKLQIELFQSANNPTLLPATPLTLVTPWGGPDIDSGLDAMPTLVALIDGASSPTWTPFNSAVPFQPPLTGGVPIPDLLVHSIELDSFIIVSEGQNFQIGVLPFTLFDNSLFPAGVTGVDIIAHYYGNLILSTGRQALEEIGNGTPAPVQIKGNTL